MKIAVAGCGAVGGVIAARINERYSPVLFCKNKEITEAISEKGLKASFFDGSAVRCFPKVYANFEDCGEKFDVIFLTMKATVLKGAVKRAVNFLSDEGFLVTFQNGMPEREIFDIVPKERVIGGIIGFGATMHSPGVAEMTSAGEIVVGEFAGGISDRIKGLKEILDNVITCRITDNIEGAKYSKLLINACITTMGAVSGMYLGDMLADSNFRKIFRFILFEGVEVAKRKGIKLEKISGVKIEKLAADKREVEGKFCLKTLFKDLIIRILGMKYSKLKSSSLQSLQRGRKTEVDYINGEIVRLGRETGFPVPVNEALVNIVHAIEKGEKEISPENLKDILPVVN